MVKLTNVLDHIFPEFKPFFNHSFSATALHILEKYHTPDIIACIPGIGYITAATIVAEYGDFSRFSSATRMLSFEGLEPGYYQSGTMEFRGKMVKRGSSQLRYVLMNCVIPLIKFNPVFASYYHKKRLEGKPHRVALSHTAKFLVSDTGMDIAFTIAAFHCLFQYSCCENTFYDT